MEKSVSAQENILSQEREKFFCNSHFCHDNYDHPDKIAGVCMDLLDLAKASGRNARYPHPMARPVPEEKSAGDYL